MTNFMTAIVSFVYKSTVLLASYYIAPPSPGAAASVPILAFYISKSGMIRRIQLISDG
jgi:hypothetical protein